MSRMPPRHNANDNSEGKIRRWKRPPPSIINPPRPRTPPSLTFSPPSPYPRPQSYSVTHDTRREEDKWRAERFLMELRLPERAEQRSQEKEQRLVNKMIQNKQAEAVLKTKSAGVQAGEVRLRNENVQTGVKLNAELKNNLRHQGYSKDGGQGRATVSKSAENQSQTTNTERIVKKQSIASTCSTSSVCQCQICCRANGLDYKANDLNNNNREESHAHDILQTKESQGQNKRKRVEDSETAEHEAQFPTPKRRRISAPTELCETPLDTLDSEPLEQTIREARRSLTLLLICLDRFDFEERRLRIEEQRLLAEERCAAALEGLAKGNLGFPANNVSLFPKENSSI